jgi:hypothetical protein
MLESLVQSLVNKHLSEFVDGLDENKLEINLLSGQVKLENVSIKPDVLTKFDLPFKISKGFIGELLLHIAWNHIASEPIHVDIKGITLFLEPILNFQPKGNVEKKLVEKKLKQLDEMERKEAAAEKKLAEATKEETKLPSKLLARLAALIGSSIHISVTDLHINLTFPSVDEKILSLGLTLDKFSLISTGSDWQQTLAQLSVMTYKRLTIDNLAIYVNNNEGIISSQEPYQYVLEPLSLDLKIAFNKSLIPKVHSQMFLDIKPVYLNFNRAQFVAVTCVQTKLMELLSRQSNVEALEAKSQLFGPTTVDRHKRYIDLYKRTYAVGWLEQLSAEEEREKYVLERDLSLEELLVGRKAARQELKEQSTSELTLQTREELANKPFYMKVLDKIKESTGFGQSTESAAGVREEEPDYHLNEDERLDILDYMWRKHLLAAKSEDEKNQPDKQIDEKIQLLQQLEFKVEFVVKLDLLRFQLSSDKPLITFFLAGVEFSGKTEANSSTKMKLAVQSLSLIDLSDTDFSRAHKAMQQIDQAVASDIPRQRAEEKYGKEAKSALITEWKPREILYAGPHDGEEATEKNQAFLLQLHRRNKTVAELKESADESHLHCYANAQLDYRTNCEVVINRFRFSLGSVLFEIPAVFEKPELDGEDGLWTRITRKQNLATQQTVLTEKNEENEAEARESALPNEAAVHLTARSAAEDLTAQISDVQVSLADEKEELKFSSGKSNDGLGTKAAAEARLAEAANETTALIPNDLVSSVSIFPPTSNPTKPRVTALNWFAPISLQLKVKEPVIQLIANPVAEQSAALIFTLDVTLSAHMQQINQYSNQISLHSQFQLDDLQVFTVNINSNQYDLSKFELPAGNAGYSILAPVHLTAKAHRVPSVLSTSLESSIITPDARGITNSIFELNLECEMSEVSLRVPTRVLYMFLPILDSIPKSSANHVHPTLPPEVEANFLQIQQNLKEQKEKSPSEEGVIRAKPKQSGLYTQQAPLNVPAVGLYQSVQEFIQSKEAELNELAKTQRKALISKLSQESKNRESGEFRSSFDPLDIKFAMKGLRIDIIDDLHETDLMFLRFMIPELNLHCNAFGSTRLATAIIPLHSLWFNPAKVAFEPVIEPITLIGIFESTYSHPVYAIEALANKHQRTELLPPPPLCHKLSLTADRILDLDISAQMLASIQVFMKTMQELHESRVNQVKSGHITKILDVIPYSFENWSQFEVQFELASGHEILLDKEAKTENLNIQPWQRQAFQIQSAEDSRGDVTAPIPLKIFVLGFEPCAEIDIRHPAVQSHYLKADDGSFVQLMLDIQPGKEPGQRVIRLRSPLGFHNSTGYALQLMNEAVGFDVVLANDQQIYFPLHLKSAKNIVDEKQQASVSAAWSENIRVRPFLPDKQAKQQIKALEPGLTTHSNTIPLLTRAEPDIESAYNWSVLTNLQSGAARFIACTSTKEVDPTHELVISQSAAEDREKLIKQASKESTQDKIESAKNAIPAANSFHIMIQSNIINQLGKIKAQHAQLYQDKEHGEKANTGASTTAEPVNIQQIFGLMFTAQVPIHLENLTCENLKIHLIEKHTQGNFERWNGSMARGEQCLVNSASLALPLYLKVSIPSLDLYSEEPLTVNPNDINDNEEAIYDLNFTNSSHTRKLTLAAALKRVALSEPLSIIIYSQYWIFDLTKLDLELSLDKEFLLPSKGQRGQIDFSEEQLPVMCSFGKAAKKHIIYLGGPQGVRRQLNWSDKVDLDSDKDANIPPANRSIPSTGAHPVGLQLESTFGKFWRTKTVSFVPKLFVLNKLNEMIKIRQTEASAAVQIVQSIEPNQQAALFWADVKATKHLSVLVANPAEQWDWSADFDPMQVGNYGVTIHHSLVDNKTKLIRLQNVEENGMQFIKITEFRNSKEAEETVALKSEEFAELDTPFHIVNHTSDYVLRFKQVRRKAQSDRFLIVYPMGHRAYCTESPLDEDKIELQVAKFNLLEGLQWMETSVTVDLEKGVSNEPIEVAGNKLFLTVTLDGEVRISEHGQDEWLDDEELEDINLFTSVPEMNKKLRQVHQEKASITAALKVMQAEKLTVMSKLASVTFSKVKRPENIPKNQSFLVVQPLQIRNVPPKYNPIKLSFTQDNESNFNATTEPLRLPSNSSPTKFVSEQFIFNASKARSHTLKIELKGEKFFMWRGCGAAELTLNQLEDIPDRWIPLMKAKGGQFKSCGEVQLRVLYIPEEANYIAEQVKLLEEMLIERRKRGIKLQAIENKLSVQKEKIMELHQQFDLFDNDKNVATDRNPTAALIKYTVRLDLIQGLPQLIEAANLSNNVSRIVCLVGSNLSPFSSLITLADTSTVAKKTLDLVQHQIEYYSSQPLIQQGESLTLQFFAVTYQPQAVLLARANIALLTVNTAANADMIKTEPQLAQEQELARDKYETPQQQRIREVNYQEKIAAVDKSHKEVANKADNSNFSLEELAQDLLWESKVLIAETFVGASSLTVHCSVNKEVEELNEQAYNDFPQASLDISLPGIGLSIIDETPAELLYISLMGVEATIDHCKNKELINFQLQKFQIDDQSADAPFPVVLGHRAEFVPAIDISLTLPQQISHSAATKAICVDFLGAKLTELDIKINEILIWKLLSFANFFLAPNQHVQELSEKSFVKRYDELVINTEGVAELHLKQLNLYEIKTNITFESKPGLRKVFKELGDFDPAAYVLSFTSGLLGGIHGLPIRLPQREIHHIDATPAEVGKIIVKYYLTALAAQGIKALGYLDVLGQPAAVISKLGTGFKDIVREPMKGRKSGHTGEGIVRGIAAPFRAATSALLTPAALIANNVAKGTASLTGDNSFAREDENRHIEPTGMREGGNTAFNAIKSGFHHGLADPFDRPASQGVVAGTAKGILGLVTKPVAGIAKGIGLALQGAANEAEKGLTGQQQSTILPMRARRKMSVNGVLTDYEPDQRAQSLDEAAHDYQYQKAKPKRDVVHREEP